MSHKLIKKIVYTGVLTLKTGLHIGGTNASLNIGGPDKFVVRNPINNIPYIPGSSLKGKMRSLIELKYGCCSKDFGASTNKDSKSGKLFGTAGKNDEDKKPSRLIVRDGELIIDNTNNDYGEEGIDFSNTDLPYTESKTEVSIDRVTAKANPRTFERIPAGAKFKINMVLNIFEDEDEKELKDILNEAIKLLQDDYLGGNGSRGYGQVEIEFKKIEERDDKYYLEQSNK
jgi:CRISPR-associated protein Csm3